MIQFIEHNEPGYATRTIVNAKSADLTIAFAVDFKTPGEILTHKAAYGKYLAIDINDIIPESNFVLNKLLNILLERQPKVINFAGNGIYTLIEHGINQDRLDTIIEIVVLYMLKFTEDKKFSIRSGGQTGVDEAALKAGDKLGLKTICLAPKNWLFRDINGIDHARDENVFLARFGSEYVNDI